MARVLAGCRRVQESGGGWGRGRVQGWVGRYGEGVGNQAQMPRGPRLWD